MSTTSEPNAFGTSPMNFAKKYECGLDQLILAWLMMIPSNPIPVLGTGKTERITSAAKTCEIQLERQDWFKLLVASQGHPVP